MDNDDKPEEKLDFVDPALPELEKQVDLFERKATLVKNPLSSENDFDYVKGNLRDLIETGASALNTLYEIAQSSEHPRAFEVFANLVKTLSEVNKDLIDVNQKEKDAPKAGVQTAVEGGVINNNNLFVGTTAELNKIIAQMSAEKQVIAESSSTDVETKQR